MHHLCGFTASQDSAAMINVAAIPDPSMRIEGNNVIVPAQVNALVMAWANGVNLDRAQLQSPSLRRILNYEISPIAISAANVSPTPLIDKRMTPIILDPDEPLSCVAAESGAGATRQNIFACLAPGVLAPIQGDVRSVRVSASTTLGTFGWTNGSLTFDQSLPAGRYQLVGGRFRSAGLLAWRAVFVGGIWRPGAPGYTTDALVDPEQFRMGNMGVWGEFDHNLPPTIDFFSVSADTTEIGVLDLIKIE